jgi:GT2 family glycosyltransferase
LAECGCDFGFIAEDDILFKPGWYAAYVAAYEHTGIHHFSWASSTYYGKRMRKRYTSVRDYRVVKTSMLNGVLLTVTPEMLRRVGGFAVMPHFWGHEHTNFTRRAIEAGLAPFYADIPHSDRYVDLNSSTRDSVFSKTDRGRGFKANQEPSRQLRPVYRPLEE